jgi:hypothetical protein
MERSIHVTLEFMMDDPDFHKFLPERLMGLGAAMQKLSQNTELPRHFSIPTDLPLQLEIRHLSPPAGHDPYPTLRVVIDAPHQVEKMRASVQHDLTEMIQRSLGDVHASKSPMTSLGFAADKPAKIEFVFK